MDGDHAQPGKREMPPTRQATREEIVARTSFFRDLKPQSTYYQKQEGIPDEAYSTVTAKTLYTLMAPSAKSGPMSAKPAIVADDNLSVIIAECPPGDKPMLHAHFHTTEHFFCLKGRFRVRWGDEGEQEIFLDPHDMIAVPKGVCRDFTNVTDETAYLLVLITGKAEEDYNDIGFAPSESEVFKAKFGEAVADKLEGIGFSFLNKRA
ncbi:cupin domain-containing protein [Falsiroseomonas selenitidurans]|uniref:Cupin domain-containing protein n=1 Tax=Falsiroseomonas selenitidurans TaxID=2716335 RepID=A0ABX1E9J1_9PROT|nr:cupin domain-containing protein [Falsiroseomonas selenitidurans]NKC33890.1 cupin domain-containing protein [Falsiroseomonas selenitidurans]